MGLITDATTGVNAQDRVEYFEHGFGTQSTQTLILANIDATGFIINARIEEIDTPPGTIPIPGYDVPIAGEAWAIPDSEVAKELDGKNTKVSFTIPAALGAATSTDDNRTGAPMSRPMPGLVKYYQIGVVFIYPGGDSEEMIGQIRLRHSVVYQNLAGEGI